MATPDTVGVIGETLLTGEAYTLRPSPSQKGKFNCWVSADAVLSLQPDGSQDTRTTAQGTDGPFERCEPDGNNLVFAYEWNGVRYIHTIAWKHFAGEFAR